MLWNKVTSSQVVSGHRKNFKWMKFNCKKPILNITLKTISLLLLRKKKKIKSTYSFMFRLFVFFKSDLRGKIVFTLKDSSFFLASPTSNPRKKKIIILALLIGKLENGKILCATHFPTETSGNPWFPWMTEITGQQYRGRKKKSQSAVSPFVSVATKPIPFSPFWCYSFMWYVNGVSFGICFGFFFFLFLMSCL